MSASVLADLHALVEKHGAAAVFASLGAACVAAADIEGPIAAEHWTKAASAIQLAAGDVDQAEDAGSALLVMALDVLADSEEPEPEDDGGLAMRERIKAQSRANGGV